MDILKLRNLIKKALNTHSKTNIYSFISVITYAVLEAVVILILARSYTPDLFGEWILFYTGFFLLDRMSFGFFVVPLIRFLSGTQNDKKKKELISSSYISAIILSFLFLVVLYLIYTVGNDFNLKYGFVLFLIWNPLISFIRIPFNISLGLLQVEGRFQKIIFLRIIGMGLFVVAIAFNLFFLNLSIKQVVIIFVISNIISSLFSIYKGWSGFTCIPNLNYYTIKKIMNFGRFSMGTSLGSSLLKDADLFLVGFFMTSKDLAIYSIPLKLIDILNIPLAAIVAIIFPKISKISQEKENDKLKHIFNKCTGLVTMSFIPLLIILFIFTSQLIWILGGSDYIQTSTTITIFRVFLLYGFFLTTDRFIGVFFDSMNKPNKNFTKVIVMVLTNIIGDLIAIYFYKSLIGVAVVTVINIIIGVYFGFLFLKEELDISVNSIIFESINFIKSVLKIGI